MEIIVPRYLELDTGDTTSDGDDSTVAQEEVGESSSGQKRRREDAGEKVMVIASGELEEQVGNGRAGW
jgi:hypothetical protein